MENSVAYEMSTTEVQKHIRRVLEERKRSSKTLEHTICCRGITVWIKRSWSLRFFSQYFPSDWVFINKILHVYCTFVSTQNCKISFSHVFNFDTVMLNLVEIGRTVAKIIAKLLRNAIFSGKMYKSTGRSRLIWHNFVDDNWTTFCNFAPICTCSRRVKFYFKILSRGNIARKPRRIFLTHTVGLRFLVQTMRSTPVNSQD